MIDSFKLDLQARNLAAGTVSLYTDAAHRLGDWLRKHGDPEDWGAAADKHIKQYITYLLSHYADGYANNQYRAIQQFFKWYAAEEDVPNPMAGLQPPKLGIKTVPVFKDDELQRLIKDCGTGRDFQSRRDTAIIRLFAATGLRLSELAGLDVTDIDLANRTAHVLGKGRKERTVKFDFKTAQAVDRYLRTRQRHKLARLEALWLSVTNRGALSANGIYQMVETRGRRLRIDVHPHKFRHHFSHRWLDEGGAEGDLMELNGWDSPQMLLRYGASARQARARRGYDRIDIFGDSSERRSA